jgi:hypothetical protein
VPDITIDAEGHTTVGGTPVPPKLVIAHHVASIIVLMVYGGLFVWYMIYTTLWFVHLPTAAQTPTVTAWIGGSQTMLSGLAGFIFKFYTDAQFGGDRR